MVTISESISEPDGPVIEYNGVAIDNPSALDVVASLDRRKSLMHDEFDIYNLSQGDSHGGLAKTRSYSEINQLDVE